LDEIIINKQGRKLTDKELIKRVDQLYSVFAPLYATGMNYIPKDDTTSKNFWIDRAEDIIHEFLKTKGYRTETSMKISDLISQRFMKDMSQLQENLRLPRSLNQRLPLKYELLIENSIMSILDEKYRKYLK
jgi:hypothetical protein